MTTTSVPVARPALLSRRYRLATSGVLLVVTLLAFEQMAVGTAMPVAARELHGLSLYAWTFSATFIAGLLANVVAGGWSDTRGPAAPLLTGLAVFVAGLALAGAATGMGWFVAGRAVQGLGAGLAAVPLYVIVARVYPKELRPKVFGAMAGAWVLPSLAGPYAGGLVAEHAGWRWVFLGLIPLVVPAALMLVPVLRGGSHERTTPERGRILAAVLVSGGAGVLLWAIDRRSLLAFAGLAALVYGLRRLLPRGTLRLRRGLPTAVAMRGLLMGAMAGTEAFIPLALVSRHGFRPATAGLVLTIGALGWSAGSWWQGRRSTGPAPRFVIGGAVLLAAGVLAVALVSPANGWLTVPAWVAAGTGMGLAYPAITVQVLGLSAPSEQGANSSALQISDSLGSALSVGLAGALVNAVDLTAGAALTTAIAAAAALAAARVRTA